MDVGGEIGKQYKGIREGGISENASYYAFMHAPDGAIDAYRLDEWHHFQPIQISKSSSAVVDFGRQTKLLSQYSSLLRKRLKGDNDEDDEHDSDVVEDGYHKKRTGLKISDMSDSDDDSGRKDVSNDGRRNIRRKRDRSSLDKKKTRKVHDVDDEALEESDGDEEGKEMDYETASSEE